MVATQNIPIMQGFINQLPPLTEGLEERMKLREEPYFSSQSEAMHYVRKWVTGAPALGQWILDVLHQSPQLSTSDIIAVKTRMLDFTRTYYELGPDGRTHFAEVMGPWTDQSITVCPFCCIFEPIRALHDTITDQLYG